MKRAVLGLLLVLPLASAAEFVPEWRRGPSAFTFEGRGVDVPAGAWFATDGASWLYVVEGADPRDEDARDRCPPPQDETLTWVLLDPRACSMAKHPSIACSGAEGVCETATGRVAPCGSGCLAPPDGSHRLQERRTFTGRLYYEVQPVWTSGPADVAWRNASLHVPASASYATDGASWLYVANGTSLLEPPPEGCHDPAGNDTTGRWVLLPPALCQWKRHPSFACYDLPACASLGGTDQPPIATTLPPTTTHPRVTPASQLTDTCGRIPGARCTPGPGAIVAATALALAATLTRASHRRSARGTLDNAQPQCE